MPTLRLRRQAIILRDAGDDVQTEAMRQAALFTLLLGGMAGACAGCWFLFWKPLLAGFLP